MNGWGGPQELRIRKWVMRPWEFRWASKNLSQWLCQVRLQPLTCLRVLRNCTIESSWLFKGECTFKEELQEAQRKMGIAPAKIEGSLIAT